MDGGIHPAQGFSVTLTCYAALVKIGITCYPTYGGSGIVATELGLELAHRGHEVHLNQRISQAARHAAGTRSSTDIAIPQYEQYYEEVSAA